MFKCTFFTVTVLLLCTVMAGADDPADNVRRLIKTEANTAASPAERDGQPLEIPSTGYSSSLNRVDIFTEDFETPQFAGIPVDWRVYDEDGDAYQWQFYDTYPYDGTFHLRIHWNTAGCDDWLVTRRIHIPSIGDSFEFYARAYSSVYQENWEVWICNTGNTPADFLASGVMIGSDNTTVTTYQNYSYTIPPAFNNTDSWIAIRCVSVDAFYLLVDAISMPNQGFSESFEGGGLSEIWSVSQVCATELHTEPSWWHLSNLESHSGSNSAGVWWARASQNEWLISPPVTLTASPDDIYYLTYWTKGWESSKHDDHYYVKISNDGGATWDILSDLSDKDGNGWNNWNYPYIIDLSAYAGDDVNIAWNAAQCDDPANPNYPGMWYTWHVDDITVSSSDICLAPTNIVEVFPQDGATDVPVNHPFMVWNIDFNRLYVDFDYKPVDLPIATGGPGLEEPVDVSSNINAIVRNAPFATQCLEITDNSPVDAGFVRFEFLNLGEVTTGTLTIDADLWFDSHDNYGVYVREQGGAARAFTSVHFLPSGYLTCADEYSADDPTDDIGTYETGKVVHLKLIFYNDNTSYNQTYDIWLDGKLLLDNQYHGIADRGLGSVFFGTTHDADLNGKFFMDNLSVTWNGGCETEYIVYRDENNPPVTMYGSGQDKPYIDAQTMGPLHGVTTYYWKVQANTVHGLVESPVWSFTTGCDCQPGNANGNLPVNILDITHLISYLYKGGPAPIRYATCSGDPDCNCTVNILDITALISFLYKGGPAPCTCAQWLSSCGLPLRK